MKRSRRPSLSSPKRPLAVWLPLLAAPILAAGGWARSADESPAPSLEKPHALLKRFCVPCHAELDTLGKPGAPNPHWTKALTRAREGTMPPKSAPQPSAAERARLVAGLTAATAIKPASDAQKPDARPLNAAPNPGRVLLHRLSREEYNNTVRDLLGVNTRPADSFPPDGSGGGGFDNNADTLFVPPILMERYLATATTLLRNAPPERLFIARPGPKTPPREAARQCLTRFATLAYRRPLEPAELDRLLSLFLAAAHQGQPFEATVKRTMKAILVSPHFLFRVERDRPGAAPYPLSDYEMASRLSYFLWASMPDAELFRLAATKKLQDPAVLDAQVRRMLKDERAQAFTASFVGQWLRVRELKTTAKPDPGRFPDYTPVLRDAMLEETNRFFDSIVRNGDSLLLLLDSDYTYLNERLAKLYEVPGVQGDTMRRVPLKDRRRGGILTQASVLTVTSFPQRTSPVLRGKWVLEEVLGTPAPPPPPNAGGLSPNDAPEAGMTFRQRLELHRNKPECASCHSRMDPLGFGLENFDGIGRWRDQIGGVAVDSSGVLENGEKFSGPVELKRHLLSEKDAFIRSLTRKMLAYALGRGLEEYDAPTVTAITKRLSANGYSATTLVTEIAKSYPFRNRRNG